LDPARIDLLTAVAHELGHLLGFEDLDSADELMSDVLSLGERHSAIDAVFADLN
jgi:hypothetical protein